MAAQTHTTSCCIAGGGPAGMMLGFLLARAGIDVVVLEKHADFLRDFRGDTIHPSTLELMHELGLLQEFLKQPHQELQQLVGQVGDERITLGDFSGLSTKCNFIALMPQWGFLNFEETLNLIHAAFFDGKEPQTELSQAPEHGPEAVRVPCENLSLIAKSNQALEHIKSVLHQGPKPALGEQECNAVEPLNLSKELKDFEQSGNCKVLIEALRDKFLIARASAALRSEIARTLAIEALINRMPDMSERFLLKIVETLGKASAFDLSAITGVWPTLSKARSRRSLSSRVPPMRLS
jgi:hypothetical protein